MTTEFEFEPKKILIIEDVREIRISLAAAFEDDDYEVIVADGGKNGLIQYAKQRPDLVITDLRLPDIQGSEVVRRIRRVSDVPIMVLSAIGDEQTKIECLDAGADDYVVKGTGMDELLARVKRQLKRVRSTPVIQAPQAGASEVPPDEITGAKPWVAGMNILLVGPQDAEQKKLFETATELEYSIFQASTYDEALKQFGVARPQLVLINTTLPGSASIRLANFIKQRRIAPVILIADRIPPVLKAKARILEVADIVSPTITANELSMRINWALMAEDRRKEKRLRALQLKKLQDELGKVG